MRTSFLPNNLPKTLLNVRPMVIELGLNYKRIEGERRAVSGMFGGDKAEREPSGKSASKAKSGTGSTECEEKMLLTSASC
jgi:hypothetical protein